MRKYRLLLVFCIATIILLFPIHIFAAEIEGETTSIETEDVSGENCGDTFYVPKSAFRSQKDYEAYCKEMYYMGYMNEDYEWTTEAKRYIKYPNNKEITDTLNESAEKIREERKEKGLDVPYMTAIDENGNISKIQEEPESEDGTYQTEPKQEGQAGVQTQVETNKKETENDKVQESSTEQEEASQQMEEEKSSLSFILNLISKAVMVFAVFAIAIGAYSIYKRQF